VACLLAGAAAWAQDGEKKPVLEAAATNSAMPAKASAGDTNAAPAEAKPDKSAEPIQLSFQGANIEMIVQWLAQTTGKTVIKHPQAQCQINIMSSKKVTPREAINLVYRALSLEGYTAVESGNSILIVPEGKEPKISPEVLGADRKDIPEGRQRLVKMFPLAHTQAADMREKVRGLLSEKGNIDVDERANQLVVTDYNENLRTLAEIIKEFDSASSDFAVQVYQLKYADAEDLGNLMGMLLNAQSSATGVSGRSSRGSSGGPPTGDNSSGGGGGSASSGPVTPPVRLFPDRNSNRLVVMAPRWRQVEVQRLLEVLDTERSADLAVRVIPLHNVNAMDLARELGPLYQKMGGKTPKEAIEVGANDRSNSLIVFSSEANFKLVEKMVLGLDTEDAMEKVMRTFALKNADASDVAKQLQDLNKDSEGSSRYFYYYSSSQSKSSKKLSVVADRRRNSLIVQAAPSQMEFVAKVIAELDEPVTDDSLAPKIYPLKYVSATDMEDVLNELFLKKTQQRSYWDYVFDDSSSDSVADKDVGRLYGKVRITSEPYSNALIVTSNSKESLAVLEKVLQQLDAPSEAGETTLHVPLRFGKAPTVANSVNILFAKNGSPALKQTTQPTQSSSGNTQQGQQQGQTSSSQSGFALEQEVAEEGYFPWLGGQPDNNARGGSSSSRTTPRPVSDLVGRVRVVADRRSNSLLVTANVHFFPQVLKLIDELDAPTAQVLIEARIVEVSSDFLDKLGVRWSPDGSKVFTADDYDNSFLASGKGTYDHSFSQSRTFSDLITEMRSGTLSSTVNLDFLIQFLRKNTGAKVLAEPQINISDNEMGKLFVGQQVPFIDHSQTTDTGGLNQTFNYKDVGVILEVTPHINTSGDVALKIRAESSSIVPDKTLFGGALIDTRNFRTDLKAKSGETLVVGGIIQKQVTDIVRKVPLLGDIPGLGYLFKKRDKESREVELMVFLRPRVTRTPQEAREMLEEIHQKTPHIREWDKSNEPAPAKDAKKEKGKA
jgi:general secretion pathway protein D